MNGKLGILGGSERPIGKIKRSEMDAKSVQCNRPKKKKLTNFNDVQSNLVGQIGLNHLKPIAGPFSEQNRDEEFSTRMTPKAIFDQVNGGAGQTNHF